MPKNGEMQSHSYSNIFDTQIPLFSQRLGEQAKEEDDY